jgi:D-amino-acid dehydrogenase
MRVIILGAGIVGVTTAYELMRDGCEVTVVEQLDAPAMFTSFANAGLVAPGHAYAWASPNAPKTLLRSLVDGSQALRFRPSLDPGLWSWTLKFLRECTAERAALNTRRKVRLCRYAQERLHDIVAREGLAYHGVTGGLLYLYRSQASFKAGVAKARVLKAEGLDLEAVSAGEAGALDPALAANTDKFAGAIYCPSDESGDAHVFTQELAERCRAGGVSFRFNTQVTGFRMGSDRVEAVLTEQGDIAGDIFVLAPGVYAARLGRELGLRLPIYPIKGYSMTVPVTGDAGAPALGGVDEDNLVAYARFGDRLRLTATAEFSGYDRGHRPQDFATMLRTARDLFPQAADYERPSYWAGLRPMTPKGTPILGRARQSNVFVNAGHGHMGWTMAPGTARITADLVAGRKAAIELDGLTLEA